MSSCLCPSCSGAQSMTGSVAADRCGLLVLANVIEGIVACVVLKVPNLASCHDDGLGLDLVLMLLYCRGCGRGRRWDDIRFEGVCLIVCLRALSTRLDCVCERFDGSSGRGCMVASLRRCILAWGRCINIFTPFLNYARGRALEYLNMPCTAMGIFIRLQLRLGPADVGIVGGLKSGVERSRGDASRLRVGLG
ncbi:uncharacterized protein EI97DRAFT_17654 [Westerdykella ornata]|uniref:Uncharacterized protein n=1 Tax=Westerdykella ornata TaxID=318751 RepID=A0A6A6JWL0_WESOR|nr:uncharacterized protein EI97DRAFT_17654 [Westerdykella ornata]KAF2280992.1 hypothetical protein EI97DRAFT_17654 [Westerdykella ornata]